MRRLLLLRHAKTETDSPSGHDQDRRLDERGHRDAAEIGGWLADNPPRPNRVLVSPAVRTRETWEIVREAMKEAGPQPKVEFVPELYGADPAQLLTTIRMASVTDPKRLMLIGHNPGMHELALTLTGSGDEASKRALHDNLPTSGLAIFDFAIDDWNEVSFRRGKLVLFVSPKLLKQASRN
ncbi:histidine phosphatase family protein [Bradyrhizobium tropiciagri]|uniref:SixA phosphatase family protein n=1 Tax=Bradyrhizobium tropiciagri TaxID=312253 RepID=UPI001BAC504E|nr:histidine phosphatase family protein [Bradyrhizobium tropiciagri]MBR0874594.1 histidine phosphatase family protein [Bradyrhizobium tropiciagri]